jgi:uncharacterized membrane protein
MSVDDRLDVISASLARILRRLDELEHRVARLEPLPAEPVIAPEIHAPPAPPPLPPPAPPYQPVFEHAAAAPKSGELETRVGLTWVNRVGVLTLVLGAAFFFKYAIDNEWIGPAARVALGILAGVAALLIGEWLTRRGHVVYAQGVSGGGIAVLYLAFWASFQLYQVLPQTTAFLGMAVTTVIAGAVALRNNTHAIAALGLIGGFLTPIVLSTGEDHPWFLFSYLLLLNTGAMALARRRSWRTLCFLAFAGTVVIYHGWLAAQFTPGKRPPATVFALAFYVLFAAFDSPILLACAQGVFGLALVTIWPVPEAVYPELALLLAALGLAFSHYRGWAHSALAPFAVFWGIQLIWQVGITDANLRNFVFLGLTAAFLLFTGWLAYQLPRRSYDDRSFELLLLAANGLFYFGYSYTLLHESHTSLMALLAVAIAALHLGLARFLRRTAPDYRPALLALGVAIALITLAIPIQFSAYRVTMAWSVEAALLAWLAARAKIDALKLAAAAVLVLVFLRLMAVECLLYPVGMDYSALANARFLTFLIAALSCWACSLWFQPPQFALVPYLGGHFIMLWGLILEVLGWAQRNTPLEHLASVESIAVSILTAAYALVLVAIGVGAKSSLNRVVGLGLIALVVLKLYVSDVWLIGKVYRVIAFSVLGALLLAISFLYSRFRQSLERLWKPDSATPPPDPLR